VAPLDGDDLISRINQVRSTLPAITHVDFSARIQTVDTRDKPDFYELLREFEALTGVGVLVNTSFNVRGEPIVCSPHDAYECFMRTDLDLLVLENCVLYKEEQPALENRARGTRDTSGLEPRLSRSLTRFYDLHLKRLSGSQENGHAARSPAGSRSSYYVRRAKTQLDRSDFELRLGDERQIAEALEEAWEGTRLLGLAKPLAKLTRKFEDVEERAELSPFLYEMF
jgi:hypothetical protein